MPKTHDKAMENLDQKLEAKAEAIKKAEKELKHLKKVLLILRFLVSRKFKFTKLVFSTIYISQAAKSGGDKGDYEKKKKAVQK